MSSQRRDLVGRGGPRGGGGGEWGGRVDGGKRASYGTAQTAQTAHVREIGHTGNGSAHVVSVSSNGCESHWHSEDGATECIHAEPPLGLDKTARNRLLIATGLCFVFMTGEIVGGVMSNSLAIISDGVHLLTDFASFLISMSALHLAQRPASNRLNFGWHRIEILGACVSILLLWILTGVLCYSAVLRIISMDFEIEPTILLITASTGVFFNVVLATVLNEDLDVKQMLGMRDAKNPEAATTTNTRDNDKTTLVPRAPTDKPKRQTSERGLSGCVEKAEPLLGQQANHKVRPKPGNINVKAAYMHVLGDLVQSIGILSSALIIYFKPEWKISDPCCTFFFSFMVLLTTMTIMKDIVVVLMEAAPKDVDVPGMKTDLLNVPGVTGLHSFRVWSLTLDKIAVSAHLSVEPKADPYQVLDEATRLVKQFHWAHETFIQLERGAGGTEVERALPV